jgi:hypothetical protein
MNRPIHVISVRKRSLPYPNPKPYPTLEWHTIAAIAIVNGDS